MFFSWDGATLDQNIPYLRSTERLNQETMKLLHVIEDHKHKHIITQSGPEQEFFLIDRSYYDRRPDLKVKNEVTVGLWKDIVWSCTTQGAGVGRSIFGRHELQSFELYK